MRLFATVGSTKFDAMINELTAPSSLKVLRKAGITDVGVQFGRGREVDADEISSSSGLKVTAFNFVPSVQTLMREADIIVCHAGAGSVFEALEACESVVTVPNRDLMDDHQTELADELSGRGIVRVADVGTAGNLCSQVEEAANALRAIRRDCDVHSAGSTFANVPGKDRGDLLAAVPKARSAFRDLVATEADFSRGVIAHTFETRARALD